MAKTRSKTQPEQGDALFADPKPRKKRAAKPETLPTVTPSAGPVLPAYVMPEERQEAIDEWLSSPVMDDEGNPRDCSLCETPVLVVDGKRLDKQGKPAHRWCVEAQPAFEFPPLLKTFKSHDVLWLDRPYGEFKAGYMLNLLYQCGPGNIYGHFGSFGLDEKTAIEDRGIKTIQIWNRTEAYQITMEDFQAKGEVAQTPPGLRWLVPLDDFEKARKP